jgi:superfamily II DNA helicase RecQ
METESMTDQFYARVSDTLKEIEEQGLYKHERQITSPQSAVVTIAGPNGPVEAINMCANNYLGLADSEELSRAAAETNAEYGFGMASVRFICGTLDLHRKLERRIADFFGYDDFREGQIEIIEAILGGKNVLAVMPTGSGKSLCYQIPALLKNNFSIVV